MKTLFRRFVCLTVMTALIVTSIPAQAQTAFISPLPQPGQMSGLSSAFSPMLLKGMRFDHNNPLRFDFIVDAGDEAINKDQTSDAKRLVNYFLAALTTPTEDLWVNLSPYEKDRIIPDELAKTELGRELLAQDYLLKQLSSSLTYPEDELGKIFWDKLYAQSYEQLGTTDVPTDLFHKVWIVPDKAKVYEHGNTVYITKSKLKVMLEEDYIQGSVTSDQRTGDISTDIMRSVIIPVIEQEVNIGKNFASLRQIFHSLILAKWYKQVVQQSLLNEIYVDQNNVHGIDVSDPSLKDTVYDKYLNAFKQGAFHYIKEDYDRLSGEMVPRKYFSGGIMDSKSLTVERSTIAPDAALLSEVGQYLLGISLQAPFFAEASGDEQSNMRLALMALITYAIYHFGWPRTLEGSLKRLGSEDENTRRRAVWHVAWHQDRAAIRGLLDRVGDHDEVEDIRLQALEALGEIKSSQTHEILRIYSTDNDPAFREAAKRGLQRWEKAKADVAMITIEGLIIAYFISQATNGFIENMPIPKELRDRLNASQAISRSEIMAAIELLAPDQKTIDHDQVVPLAEEGLKSDGYLDRKYAINILRLIGKRGSIEPLKDLRAERNKELRKTPKYSLQKTGWLTRKQTLTMAHVRITSEINDINTAIAEIEQRDQAMAVEKIIVIAAIVSVPLMIAINAWREKQIQPYIDQLDGPSAYLAIQKLGELGYKIAFGPLIEKFKDPDYRLKAEVAKALGQIKHPDTYDFFMEMLGMGDFREAIIGLGELGDKDAVPVLINYLENVFLTDNNRLFLLEALGKLGDPATAVTIAEAYEDKLDVQDIPLQLAVLKTWRQLKNPAVYDQALPLLESNDLSVQMEVIETLIVLDEKRALDSLKAQRDKLAGLLAPGKKVVLLSDSDPILIHGSLKARIRTFESAIKRIKTGDPDAAMLSTPIAFAIGTAATAVFGVLAREMQIRRNMARADHADARIRVKAIKQLGKLKAKRAFGVLTFNLLAPESVAAKESAKALAQINATGTYEEFMRLLKKKDYNPTVVIIGLGELGDKRAAFDLAGRLGFLQNDTHFDQVLATVEALGKIGGPKEAKILDGLFSVLEGLPLGLQLALLKTSAQLKSSALASYINSALKPSKHPDLQIAAIELMGVMGDPYELPRLQMMQRTFQADRNAKDQLAAVNRTIRRIKARNRDAAMLTEIDPMHAGLALVGVLALSLVGAPFARKRWAMKNTHHADPQKRIAGIKQLAKFKDEVIVDRLIIMSEDDESYDVRVAAVWAMGQVGGELVEEQLKKQEFFNSSIAEVQAETIKALAYLNQNERIDEVLRKLRHESALVRQAAILFLVKFHNEKSEVIHTLASHYHLEGDTDVLKLLAELLIDVKHTRVQSVLFGAWHDFNEEKFARALLDNWGIDFLVEKLAEADTRYEGSAIKALALSSDPKAMEAILLAFQQADPDANLRRIGLEVLEQLNYPGFALLVREDLKSADITVRRSAMFKLVQLNDEGSLDDLKTLQAHLEQQLSQTPQRIEAQVGHRQRQVTNPAYNRIETELELVESSINQIENSDQAMEADVGGITFQDIELDREGKIHFAPILGQGPISGLKADVLFFKSLNGSQFRALLGLM